MLSHSHSYTTSIVTQMRNYLDDFKFALRRLWRSPGFTTVAILTLTLAIGANTAIFSIADAVLFQPLPYKDPSRIHILEMLDRQTGKRFLLTPYEYLQTIEEYHRGVGEVGMSEPGPKITVVTDGDARSIPTLATTTNYFHILGVRPAHGRLFDSRDSAQSGRAAMLTYAAWRQRFGGDEKIVGSSITLGTTTFDIVGVLPARFVFPSPLAGRPEIVTVMAPKARGSAGGAFHPIVRLEPSVTREQAQAEIQALTAPLAAVDPRTANQTPVLNDIRSVLYPTGQSIMAFLLAAAAFVLLIGCANLANMLLARVQIGERELGVRIALGASRARLMRPLIFEAVFIGLAGAMLALLVTTVTFDALLSQVPPIVYRNAPVGVGLRVALFTIGLGLLAGLVFSIVPAWWAARADAQSLIQGRLHRAGGRGYLGRSMIAIQVALAVLLVFGAVITSRAFLSMLGVPLGFTPEKVITVQASPAGLKGNDLQAFYAQAIETVMRRDGVMSVGAASSLPLGGGAPDEGARALGASEMTAGIFFVLPSYFETVGIPLIDGRLLDWNDVRSGADASVVSESAARALFPGRSPLGAAFQNSRGRQFVVVGVVADVRGSLERESSPNVYAIPSEATRFLTLVVRMRSRQDVALAEIRREITRLAPGTLVTAEWWADTISALPAYRNPRFQTLVLSTFATLALGLTALGVFGVVAFWVVVRFQEMGIRLALGASPHSLVRLMMKQTLAPVTVGLLIGIVVTNWASRLAEAQLYQVKARDPVTLAATAMTVIVVALLAAYVPARRASKIDPIIVLKAE